MPGGAALLVRPLIPAVGLRQNHRLSADCLASGQQELPAQRGIPAGPAIQTLTFAVIMATTVLCTLLFFLVEKRRILSFYTWFFGSSRPVEAPANPP